MSLAEFASELRRGMLAELEAGRPPGVGTYDESRLAEAFIRGRPKLGALNFVPDSLEVEFVFGDGPEMPVVFAVTVPSPERIVFLSVPSWVVEHIWQGHVMGSHHFASDAERLVREFEDGLSQAANMKLFGPRPPTTRE